VGAWVGTKVGVVVVWCGVGAVPSLESRRVALEPKSASEMETSCLLASEGATRASRGDRRTLSVDRAALLR
jgi:hypothetical protein